MRRFASWLVLLAGCAHAPVESAAPDWKLLGATPDITEIQFQTTENLNRATVTESGARGPFVDLRRTPGKIQGTVRIDWSVDLQRRGNAMVGRFAGDSYDLTYPAATLDRSKGKLTHRVRLNDEPQIVPDSGWQFNATGTAISLLPAGTKFVQS